MSMNISVNIRIVSTKIVQVLSKIIGTKMVSRKRIELVRGRRGRSRRGIGD
jgi:hypothetical protein